MDGDVQPGGPKCTWEQGGGPGCHCHPTSEQGHGHSSPGEGPGPSQPTTGEEASSGLPDPAAGTGCRAAEVWEAEKTGGAVGGTLRLLLPPAPPGAGLPARVPRLSGNTFWQEAGLQPSLPAMIPDLRGLQRPNGNWVQHQYRILLPSLPILPSSGTILLWALPGRQKSWEAKMGDFHITVKITFLLDSQQHPETEKANVDFPLLLFHPPLPTFFFFP